MKKKFDAPGLLAALGIAVAISTGCAATSGLEEQGGYSGGEGSASAVRSPAAERVIAGIAEMVLTNQAWPTFEEARDNPMSSLEDGAPLYAYIRATRALGELAHPADPSGNYAFSDYPHLFLQVGDNESLRILGTCYITLTGEEARMREVVVPLAPLTYRPGQVPADCWLATVASGRQGKRTYEVRLAGFAGKFESWLPVPDILAVAPLATDFADGAAEYATMLRATPIRNATLLASNSVTTTAVSATSVIANSATFTPGGSAAPVTVVTAMPVAEFSVARPPVVTTTVAPAPVAPAPVAAAPVAAAPVAAAPVATAPVALAPVAPSNLVPVDPGPFDAAPYSVSPFSVARVDASPAASAPVISAAINPAALGPSSSFATAVATPIRSPTLVATSGAPLPGPRQDIGSSRMELQLQTLSAAMLGSRPSEAYFLEPEWTSTRDQRGRVIQQHAHAAAIFKGASCSWLRLRAFRRPGAASLLDVVPVGEPIEISCIELR